MIPTRSTQAGAEPRAGQTWFGLPVSEFRLQTRILLMRLLGASPLPSLAHRLRPSRDLILCLHNVVANHGALGVNRGLDVTAHELEALLVWLQSEGYRATPIENMAPSARPDARAGERRVALTFDDGYAGNIHVAYPLLRRHGIPFTVYVTTGFMDREVRVWWYALERLLTTVEHVAFEHADRTHAYTTVTQSQKIEAYRAIRALLLAAAPSTADRLLEQLFDGTCRDLKALGDEDLLTPDQVRTLCHDPLVTIGAHTVSHPVLRSLADEDSLREIQASRQRLEAVTGAAVRHFAYPFGNRLAFGPREEQFVRQSGYVTATSTAARQVAASDRPTALPRILLSAEFDAVAALRVLRTGWFGRRD